LPLPSLYDCCPNPALRVRLFLEPGHLLQRNLFRGADFAKVTGDEARSSRGSVAPNIESLENQPGVLSTAGPPRLSESIISERDGLEVRSQEPEVRSQKAEVDHLMIAKYRDSLFCGGE